MAVRTIKGKWSVDFWFNGRRYRKKSPLDSKGGARAYETYLMQRLLSGQPLTDAPPETTTQPRFEDFAWQWFETYVITNNKPSEQRAKKSILENHLVPEFGCKVITAITGEDIERFKARQITAGFRRKSVNNHLAVLRRCLRTAEEWGRLPRAPRVQALSCMLEPPGFLSDEEVTRLLSDAAEPVWNLMVRVAVRTGMRRGELLGLDWGDVRFQFRVIVVRRSLVGRVLGTPKSNKVREIPMTSDVREALLRRRRASGFVFSRRGGGPLADSTGHEALQRICARTAVHPIGWHTLRHTFASQLVARGVSLRAIQELLGHSTIQMTQRYAHLAPSDLRRAMEVLEVPMTLGSGWASTGPPAHVPTATGAPCTSLSFAAVSNKTPSV